MFAKTATTFAFFVGFVCAFTPLGNRHHHERSEQRIWSVGEQIPPARADAHLHWPISSYLRETSTDGPEKPKALTPDAVAEMAEVSFLNACLQLAQGFVDVLKLFIVAVKAGYELNMSSAELIERIDNVSPPSAGRDLMPEEIKLRNTWICVIYLVLETLQHTKQVIGDSVTAVDNGLLEETFSSDLLAEMRQQHDAGESFQLEHWLANYPLASMDDPTERAITAQTFRVIWFTFTVLKEEQVCLEEKSGLKAQPPIPGAFGDE